MKGLLRNNLYTALSSAKIFSVAMLLFGIFVVAVISQPLLIAYAILSMVGFSMISILGLHKEHTSKWGKYKLTTPVKRSDIVKSYFISQMVWLFVGTAIAMLGIGLSILLHGFPFDRSIDVLMIIAMGIAVTLFMNAIFFPLHYLGDDEKTEVFLIISLLCSIGLVMSLSSLINWFFGPNMNTSQMLVGISIIILCAVISFAVSFPITATIFSKKEY